MTDEPTGTISVPWPFYRAKLDDQFESWWIPGHEVGYDQHGNERRCADGMGEMTLTVVHVCDLPKPYRPRVFFTRQFRAPDGRLFGKRGLCVAGIAAFTRMAAGYAYPVEID